MAWSDLEIAQLHAGGRYDPAQETGTGTDGRKATHRPNDAPAPPIAPWGDLTQPHMTLGPTRHLVTILRRGEEVSLLPDKGDPDIQAPRIVTEDTRTPIRQLPPLIGPTYRTWALYDDEVVAKAKREAGNAKRR